MDIPEFDFPGLAAEIEKDAFREKLNGVREYVRTAVALAVGIETDAVNEGLPKDEAHDLAILYLGALTGLYRDED